jgi:hypothetical protein
MRANTIKSLSKSLNEILKIDPIATFEFEDCGSGTTVLNIIFSKEGVKKITIEDLDRLEKFDISGDDEGSTVKTRLLDKSKLFICLS